MDPRRRRSIASLAALALATPGRAAAQSPDWPAKPIRLVVPFAPGAANDIIGRLVAGRLADALRQPVTVENRPGAGGSVGAGAVARAAPDGYTLGLMNPGPGVLTPLLTQGRLYKVEDLDPVALVCTAPLLLVASTRFAPNTAGELVELARAQPKKVVFASADAGGIVGVAMLLFLAATGIEVNAVPYSGSAPAMTDLSGGHVDATFASYASALPHLKSGRAKVIGVAAPRRTASLPTVPTLAESGIRDAETVAWWGISAPAGTPRPIVERLNREVNRALELPEVRQRLEQLDLEPASGSPEDFRAMVRADAARAAKLIAAGLLRPE
jgi:tripartite-type tricarboxylate transporter receptor subunit TctC